MPKAANRLYANMPNCQQAQHGFQREFSGPARTHIDLMPLTKMLNSSGVAQFSGESNHHCKGYLLNYSSLRHEDHTKLVVSALVTTGRHDPCDSRTPLCCQIIPKRCNAPTSMWLVMNSDRYLYMTISTIKWRDLGVYSEIAMCQSCSC